MFLNSLDLRFGFMDGNILIDITQPQLILYRLYLLDWERHLKFVIHVSSLAFQNWCHVVLYPSTRFLLQPELWPPCTKNNAFLPFIINICVSLLGEGKSLIRAGFLEMKENSETVFPNNLDLKCGSSGWKYINGQFRCSIKKFLTQPQLILYCLPSFLFSRHQKLAWPFNGPIYEI